MKAELKPEELRIGNWVTVGGSLPDQVTGYHLYMMETYVPVDPNEADYKEMTQLIELSEDWLMRGQFSKNAVGNWVKRYGESNFKHFAVRVENGKFYYPTGKHKRIELPYVHTLQNLYHLATGNELIFNHG